MFVLDNEASWMLQEAESLQAVNNESKSNYGFLLCATMPFLAKLNVVQPQYEIAEVHW